MKNSIEPFIDIARHCRESIVSWKLGASQHDLLIDNVLEICREFELEGANWSRSQIQHYLGFTLGALLAKGVLSAEHVYQLTTVIAQANGENWDEHAASQTRTECPN